MLSTFLAAVVMTLPCGTYDGPGHCEVWIDGVAVYSVTAPGVIA